ncbi:MAG: Aurachin B dehydrogenase [Anaerolineae bacterium]|nr:Aurachin B dehydrogenase [Anaerolineae bacterium]
MIFVTGATGFLGRNLCKHLVNQGYKLRALIRPTSDATFLNDLGVDVVVGDLCDETVVQVALDGCEQVIHAAANFRLWGASETFEIANVLGTNNLLKAASMTNVRQFVHISTIIVVGPQPRNTIITEQIPCTPYPGDHYACTKLKAEKLALSYLNRGLNVVVLRLGALYGPWGHYAFNRLFFEEFLNGWRVQVNRGRHITFPCYVGDAVVAIELALRNAHIDQKYNICGKCMTHSEINTIVSQLAGKGHWRINLSKNVMVSYAHILELLARFTRREPFYPLNLVPYVFEDWIVSTEKACNELGFVPTSFAEGAKRTLEWYKSINFQ